MGISSRIPRQNEIASVYAVIVLMVYGWTILKFNYNLPGWLYFLNMGEIMGVLAYSMVVNLLESLLVLAGVLVLGMVLPRKVFSDAFVARGVVLSALVLALFMYIASQFSTRQYYPAEIIRWSPLILGFMALVAWWIGRFEFLRRVVESFADRAVVFLYISIPLSMFSLLVVLVQNIF